MHAGYSNKLTACFKGHRYASVILDADTRRVLYIAPGRSRKSLRPFFEALGKQGCQRIQAVAMDMNTAFDAEVKHWCPKAKVVYDLFHVVAKSFMRISMLPISLNAPSAVCNMEIPF